MGIMGIFCLLFLINRDKSHVRYTDILATVLIFIIFYSGLLYYNIQKNYRIPSENGSMLGDKEIDFRNDAIVYADKYSNGQYNWEAIKSMDENRKSFYLYIDTDMAIVVPKRFFVDKKHEQEFRELVQQKLSRV